MGITMSQKTLVAHAGLKEVKVGQPIKADLSLVLGNDITSPVVTNEVKKMDRKAMFGRDKIALVMDYFIPNKDIKPAESCKCCRGFVCRHEITNCFDMGDIGIGHTLLPGKGLIVAGDAVIGVDSHTCTYRALGAFSTGVRSTDMAAGMVADGTWFRVPSVIKFELVGKPPKWVGGKGVILRTIGMISVGEALYKSMEFMGGGIKTPSMGDRFTICNMAIEAGGKSGIFPVDELTVEHMKEHLKRALTVYEADEDAEYNGTYTIDLLQLKPIVSFPYLPSSTRNIDQTEDVKVDQVVIGSCTNGRIEDMRIAAKVLKGRKIARGARCIVIPAIQPIYLRAMREGLLETFIEARAMVSTPTCGPCLGGCIGILVVREKCIPMTNRNFVGRMGHVSSGVYLTNPTAVVASAVAGKIICPCQLG